MHPQRFCSLLIRAAQVTGSLLDVAFLLGVEPLLVYCWIAGVECPMPERVEEFGRRLCLFISQSNNVRTGIHLRMLRARGEQ
jgi:hypothetical protein